MIMKRSNILLLTVMLIYVFSLQNLFASQEYKSFLNSNNGGSNMAVTENEYTLDQQNKGYRNFNQDTAAGLYYLHARYYDPNTRQFLTTDPARMKNLYGYCVKDPVNEWDPTGQWEWPEWLKNFFKAFCYIAKNDEDIINESDLKENPFLVCFNDDNNNNMCKLKITMEKKLSQKINTEELADNSKIKNILSSLDKSCNEVDGLISKAETDHKDLMNGIGGNIINKEEIYGKLNSQINNHNLFYHLIEDDYNAQIAKLDASYTEKYDYITSIEKKLEFYKEKINRLNRRQSAIGKIKVKYNMDKAVKGYSVEDYEKFYSLPLATIKNGLHRQL